MWGCKHQLAESIISGYESQFDKKSFAEELELSELENFFRECDLYPSSAELEDGIDVIFQGKRICLAEY